ncbi:uncharacterized protein LOC144365464 [Ictidomys tridecemlineatus]
MARAAAAARCPGSRPASGRVPRAPRVSPSVSPPPPPPAFRSRGAQPHPPARLALAPGAAARVRCRRAAASGRSPRPPPPPRSAPGSVPRGEGGGRRSGERRVGARGAFEVERRSAGDPPLPPLLKPRAHTDPPTDILPPARRGVPMPPPASEALRAKGTLNCWAPTHNEPTIKPAERFRPTRPWRRSNGK